MSSFRWSTLPSHTFLIIVVGLLAASENAGAATTHVYGVGTNNAFGNRNFYVFEEDGSLIESNGTSGPPVGSDIVANGRELLISSYAFKPNFTSRILTIDRFDVHGSFLGQFADLSSLVGPEGYSSLLETDAAGSIYTCYLGFAGLPRTSFRLDSNGNITATYSHPQLTSPGGIDATAAGEVYILESSGNRLFKFSGDGQYLTNFAIPQVGVAEDLFINESTQEIVLADFQNSALQIFGLDTGSPVFRETIPMAEHPVAISFEPIQSRIFGTSFSTGTDAEGVFFKYTGFEISRDGTILNTYAVDADPRSNLVLNIVAVSVPEPSSLLLVMMAAVFATRRTRLPVRG